MTTINLKDFYYWYLSDELVEVPEMCIRDRIEHTMILFPSLLD